MDDHSPLAVGGMNDLAALRTQYGQAVAAIGNAAKRLELTERLRRAGYRIATIISPLAYVSRSAEIREGCVIEALSVVNTHAVVGECCLVSAGAVINHNAVLGEGCHIDCHATIGSNVKIAPLTKIEYGKAISLESMEAANV